MEMVMMWIIGVMNWHMGRLRRGQKWSNDGSEGACQPHIDDHATENDDEVNTIIGMISVTMYNFYDIEDDDTEL